MMTVGLDSGNRRLERDTERPPGVGILAALEGVGLFVWHLIATPFIRRERMQWGTVGGEASDVMPGDELVPEPKWSSTLGITVDASPEDVWPWVAQIGQGRGGFYTYQTLENLVGAGITNVTEILPDHQHPKAGEGIALASGMPPLRIAAVDPPNTLVLFGSPAGVGSEDSWGMSTWQFGVKAGPDGDTRFLTRSRYDHSPDWKARITFGRFPLEVISFVMSRKMMLEIKRLAERQSRLRSDR